MQRDSGPAFRPDAAETNPLQSPEGTTVLIAASRPGRECGPEKPGEASSKTRRADMPEG